MLVVTVIAIAMSIMMVQATQSTNSVATQSTNQWVLSVGVDGASTIYNPSISYKNAYRYCHPTTVAVRTGKQESDLGLTIGLGRKGQLGLPTEYGVRQSFDYNDDNTDVSFRTALYNDWTLVKFNRFDVFAGANVAIQYGDIQEQFTASPEAGIRAWLSNRINLFVLGEYPFDIRTGQPKDEIKGEVGLSATF